MRIVEKSVQQSQHVEYVLHAKRHPHMASMPVLFAPRMLVSSWVLCEGVHVRAVALNEAASDEANESPVDEEVKKK